MKNIPLSALWNTFVMLLLLAAGVYLTISLKFFPFTKAPSILKNTIGALFTSKRKKDSKNFSPFQAATTSLAGTMGIGNIVGISTAITLGGPGAIFWMLIGALFGMCTKYTEILLAVHYRKRKPDGTFVGGPMYYLADGLGMRKTGWLFSLACALCALGIGNMTQSNAIAQALRGTFTIPAWLTGATAMVLCAAVIMGGVHRIGAVTEKLVPLMSILYLVGAVVAIWDCRGALPGAWRMMVEGAFGVKPVTGGIAGALAIRSMRYGFARGVFSNEAGLGSAPIAHGGSNCENAVKQGFWGIIEVFWDTMVGCTATALVILTSGLLGSGLDGGDLTTAAFAQQFGSWGGVFVSVSIAVFAVSSIFGWWVYGERAVLYLSHDSKGALFLYKLVFLSCIFIGAVMELGMVWELSDLLNGLMALPNLLALFLLLPAAAAETKRFFHSNAGRQREKSVIS